MQPKEVTKVVFTSTASILAIVLVTILVGSTLEAVVERVADRGGNIEFSLRVHFLYGSGLTVLLLVYTYFTQLVTDIRIRILAIALTVHLLIAMTIWLLDPVNFTREFSSIRFVSSGSLILAGLIALGNALVIHWYLKSELAGKWFWGLAGCAFIAAGIDDRFGLHEWIGEVTQPAVVQYGWPEQLVQDGITAIYGIGALLFLKAFSRYFLQEMCKPHRLSGYVLATGVCVFIVAIGNDVLDRPVGVILYPANPEFLMNFTEELLEFTAAVLFSCASIIALLEILMKNFDHSLIMRSPAIDSWARRSVVVTALLSLVLPAAAVIVISDDRLAAVSDPSVRISLFADATDGLDSVDELTMVPGLGLLVGNEGSGEILVFDELGNHQIFARGIGSPDGITSDGRQIYVADELAGNVLVFDYSGLKLAELEGLESPEGVAIDSFGDLYVADSASRLVVKLDGSEREILASPLNGLRSPEQLAFGGNDSLYITDELARAIFLRRRDGEVSVIADSSQGLRIPEGISCSNERCFVADAGTGVIYSMDDNGRLSVVVDFLRKKDLAGLTRDSKGALYVAVTSSYRPYNQILKIEGIGDKPQ